jgi:putative glycosyltransferase (TIGR04372 family)
MIRKIRTLFRIVPSLQFGILMKKLPKALAPVIFLATKCLLFFVPLKYYKFFPKYLAFLILTSANWIDLKKLKRLRFEDLNVDANSKELMSEFYSTLKYFEHGKLPQTVEKLNNSKVLDEREEVRRLINWSVWHASHNDLERIVSRVVELLNENKDIETINVVVQNRFLEDYCSNMGHLALLFLYIKKYRQDMRVLFLPNRKPANNFFYKLIEKKSPLPIVEVNSNMFKELQLFQIDTFQYSMKDNGRFGLEPEGISFPKTEFPEYSLEDKFFLELSSEEMNRGRQLFEEAIGEKDFKWFAVLHVREPENGNIQFSQARDANILSYSKMAKSIDELGGKLIRMGDKRFPKLDSNFKAFDYAHSEVRSEFMDNWLWANCKFWIGNISGAAFPPICFGKPRLLTNQWHWYLIGPSQDFVLRKQLLKVGHENVVVSPKDVLNSRLSRTQDRGWLKRMGFKVKENTPDELDQALKVFYNFHFGDSSLYGSREKSKDILYLESVLGSPDGGSTMKLLN